MSKLYLAGGCFWCISDYYLSLDKHGVIDVTCGYSGGDERTANYKLVKSQLTNHRETIEIEYDESHISVKELLDIYFSYVDIHDKDGQYIDKGYSYTLALYYQSEKEKELFIEAINDLTPPVYVAIEPFKFFIKAEDYHQHFGKNHPEEFLKELKDSKRTCHINLKKKN